jgi:hypothetical protein
MTETVAFWAEAGVGTSTWLRKTSEEVAMRMAVEMPRILEMVSMKTLLQSRAFEARMFPGVCADSADGRGSIKALPNLMISVCRRGFVTKKFVFCARIHLGESSLDDRVLLKEKIDIQGSWSDDRGEGFPCDKMADCGIW